MFLYLVAAIFFPSLDLCLPVDLSTRKAVVYDQRAVPKGPGMPVAVERTITYKDGRYESQVIGRVYATLLEEKGVGNVFEVELETARTVRFVQDSEYTFIPYFGQEFARDDRELSGVNHPSNIHVVMAGGFIILTYLDGRKLIYERFGLGEVCTCGKIHYNLVKEFDARGREIGYTYEDGLLSKVEEKSCSGKVISKVRFFREWEKDSYALFFEKDNKVLRYNFLSKGDGYQFSSLQENNTVLDQCFFQDEASTTIRYLKDHVRGGTGFYTDANGDVVIVNALNFAGRSRMDYFLRYSPGKIKVQTKNGTAASYELDDRGRVKTIRRNHCKEELEYSSDGKRTRQAIYQQDECVYDKKIEYDDYHNITKITELIDGVERGTLYEYDGRCRCVQMKSAKGIITETAYLEESHLPISVKEFDDKQLLKETLIAYDADHNKVREETIEGGGKYHRLTHFVYDSNLHLVKVYEGYIEGGIEKRLGGESYTYEGDYVVEVVKMDAGDREVGKKQYSYEKGRVTAYQRDFDGEIKKVKYDVHGRVVEESSEGYCLKKEYMNGDKPYREFEEVGDQVIETVYTYDDFGRCNHVKSSLKEEDIEYDFLGRISKKGDVYFTYDVLGRVVEKRTPSGVTSYKYKGSKDPAAVYHPDGTCSKKEEIEPGVFSCVSQRGISSEKVFDKKGNLIYEKCGKKEYAYLYEGSLLIEKKEPEDRVTHYFYDGAKRLVRVEGATSQFLSYDCFSNLTKEQIDGVEHLYSYDGNDRIIREVICGKEKLYEYDHCGNKTEKFEGDGFPIEQFDGWGRKTKVVHSDHSVENIQYKGNRVFHKQQDGRSVEQEFSEKKELKEKRVYNASGELESRAVFAYNGAGNILKKTVEVFGDTPRKKVFRYCYDKSGEHLRQKEGGATEKYIYNTCMQLVEKRKGDGLSIYYAYDEYGRVERVYSSDGTIDYQLYYDLLDRLRYVKDYIHEIDIERRYDQAGNLLSEKFGNHFILNKYYNGRRVACRLPGGILIKYRYAKNGALLAIARERGYIHSYVYDAKGKVEEERHPFDSFTTRLAYTKDGKKEYSSSPHLSQRLYFEGEKVAAIETDHQYASLKYSSEGKLLCEGGRCYEYDRRGVEFDHLERVQKDRECHFTYDAFDRVIAIKNVETGEKERYYYDYFGRVRRVERKSLKSFIYDGDHEIGSFEGEAINEVAIINPFDGRKVAVEKEGRVLVPEYDLFGNIAFVVDGLSRECIWKCNYGAYGEKENLGEVIPWWYQGKRSVWNDSVMFFPERAYYKKRQMFLTKDPMEQDHGMFPHTYCKNNPYKYEDRDGLVASEIYMQSSYLPGQIKDRIVEAFSFPQTREKKIYMVNGLNTSKEYIDDCARYMETFFEQEIETYYRPDKTSIFGVMAEWLGSNSRARELARNIQSDLQKGVDGVVLFGHSAGGATIKNAISLLNKAERNKVEVYTYGAASLIDANSVKSASNYYSARDHFMAMLQDVRYLGANRKKMVFLPSLEKGGVMDHSLMGETYRSRWLGDLAAQRVH